MSFQSLHPVQLAPLISRCLEEDWGYGDWTTDLCVPAGKLARAQIVAKQDCLVAGLEIAELVFRTVDASLQIRRMRENGDMAARGDTILEIQGLARSILKAERVALNFLARTCGIASLTAEFVKAIAGTKAQLLDTRKTTPGIRIVEKSATVVGGARNHRFGLCDGAIVKENHIRAAGSIKLAVESLLESLPPTLNVEVEVSNLDEVQQALDAGADLIMLDNMSVSNIAMAVRTVRGRALIEASGNVTLDNVRQIAEAGVDFISTGAIIHSSKWSDLSLLFDL